MSTPIFCPEPRDEQYTCAQSVDLYRQCGPCKLCIGYCPKHGGDERAQEEMKEHINKEHPHSVQASQSER